ncbi:MAG: hypothetical protein P1U54_06290 [Immundisolibacteraceae bacterium]|nr:hypothetical protein [Immundisolibacteraceae bacterium]
MLKLILSLLGLLSFVLAIISVAQLFYNFIKLLGYIDRGLIEGERYSMKPNINIWLNPTYIFQNKYIGKRGIPTKKKAKKYAIKTILLFSLTWLLFKLVEL